METVTLAAVLRRAAQLVRRGWARGTYARTKSGGKVPWEHSEATSFCMSGAIRRAARELDYNQTDISNSPDHAVRSRLPSGDPLKGAPFSVWNDRQEDGETVALELERLAKVV